MKMRAAELDAEAALPKDGAAGDQKGRVAAGADTPADALLTAFAAAATEQLVLSVPPPTAPTPPKREGEGGGKR